MVLRDYLAAKGIKLSDLEALTAFGRKFDPPASGHAVRKWARGERMPRLAVLRQFNEITEGGVTGADFMREQKAA
jgi:hypothetical protein